MSTPLARPARRTLSSRLPRPNLVASTHHHHLAYRPSTAASPSLPPPAHTTPYSTTRTTLAASRSNSNDSSSFFGSGPAPPRLPEAEQKIFEDLQRRSTGAFSAPATEVEEAVAEAAAVAAEQEAGAKAIAEEGGEGVLPELRAQVRAQGDGDELHPDVRRGAGPEFEGETNPRTGEVGGPKNNPLRWGGDADWSFNGRVTDF